MDAEAICYLSIRELATRLREGKLSSVDVTRCILDRIHRLNPRLHAYLTVLDEAALKAAAQADAEIRGGRWRGLLHGVPVAVKDLCQTKGVLTTCASRVLRDWRPDSSATVAERFEAAGAVLLGKLNLTEFAVAWYHPEMPTPLSPWGANYWPGASSSGSGAATAAGLCFASIGTDTGGSIRFPSAACGIVGLKPTWGRVSRHGVFPLGESLDHVGPMTRSVADAAVVLGVIAGRDDADETSLAAPVEDYAAALDRGVKGIRIGVDEKYISAQASPEVATAVSDAVRVLERLGGRVVKVTLPDVEPGIAAWTTICAADALAAHERTYPTKASEYGPGFRSFLEVGTSVRSQDYAKAHMVRERFANRFQELFDQVDVVACPSMSVASLPANGMPPDARGLMGPNPLLHFTAPFNLSRNPTLSQPCGKSLAGPPPSLQLVGRHLGEATLIQAGAAFERATEWHNQRPPQSAD
ncbi:MAG: amidase [Candidatus Binataceae bacterium]|nr:amidase [Candidatus Binataceae bacterium]